MLKKAAKITGYYTQLVHVDESVMTDSGAIHSNCQIVGRLEVCLLVWLKTGDNNKRGLMMVVPISTFAK